MELRQHIDKYNNNYIFDSQEQYESTIKSYQNFDSMNGNKQ